MKPASETLQRLRSLLVKLAKPASESCDDLLVKPAREACLQSLQSLQSLRSLRSRTKIDSMKFMRVMKIASRKRTPSPVRLEVEDSSILQSMLLVDVTLQLGSII